MTKSPSVVLAFGTATPPRFSAVSLLNQPHIFAEAPFEIEDGHIAVFGSVLDWISEPTDSGLFQARLVGATPLALGVHIAFNRNKIAKLKQVGPLGKVHTQKPALLKKAHSAIVWEEQAEPLMPYVFAEATWHNSFAIAGISSPENEDAVYNSLDNGAASESFQSRNPWTSKDAKEAFLALQSSVWIASSLYQQGAPLAAFWCIDASGQRCGLYVDFRNADLFI